jgi:arylsulfatase A-like enzyme
MNIPIQIILLQVLGALLTGACNRSQETPRPNVILILSDDQGWGDLSIHGNLNLETPNVDRLAMEGVSFENFYVNPFCSPTRAELLTGRYNFRCGIYSASQGGERIDLDEATLAEVFKQAGYKTAAYGKWHNGMQYPYHPNARGFDDFYGFCSGHWGNYFSPMLEHNGKIVKGEGFVIDDFTDHGLEFIEEHQDEPFFLYLPFNTPHTPFSIPDEWWDRLKDKELLTLQDPEQNENLDRTRCALALCENIDWNVGRIHAKLEELGLEEHTILLYLCDNGPNGRRWNGGMKGTKGSRNEGGVRSPLFIKWTSSIPENKSIRQIATVTDLLPTLADLCHIDYEPHLALDGISLHPLIMDPDHSGWDDRYIVNNKAGHRGLASVRNQKFRLGDDDKLYDIENDRGQQYDVSDQYPEVKHAMEEARREYIEQWEAELPEMDTRPFILGHPEARYTQLPARDGEGHGNIERSNRYANCSYFTSWTSEKDSITWEIEVPEEGNLRVELYYSCPEGSEGSVVELSFGNSRLISEIREAHDPPFLHQEKDRYPRAESYAKEFKALDLGIMGLKKGKGTLTLKAKRIKGKSVMDFRLLMFERI